LGAVGAAEVPVFACTCVQVTVPPTTELEGNAEFRRAALKVATCDCPGEITALGKTLKVTVEGGVPAIELDANLGAGKFVLGS
jgi:hypothetical protein